AKSFYDRLVGWDIEPRQAGEMDYRKIRVGDGEHVGGVMRLTDEMLLHGARPVWLGYVAVDDVDDTVNRIEAQGGKTHLPGFDIPGVGRIAMVTDPQDNPFYVMKPTPPKGDEDKKSTAFSTSAIGHVNWNELATADPLAARQFYGGTFGWTSDQFMPMGELGEYRFFAHHGTTIGAVSGCVEGTPAGWRYYVRVPSISNAVDAVKTGGGTISMGPHEVPDGDHIIIGNDPQGAEFALVGKP
ncbi:MAG TPA: VOC family protein, partial [Sphingomicrobium sp.]|nr:VOC family protein [Sphingomicrobium sp.]